MKTVKKLGVWERPPSLVQGGAGTTFLWCSVSKTRAPDRRTLSSWLAQSPRRVGAGFRFLFRGGNKDTSFSTSRLREPAFSLGWVLLYRKSVGCLGWRTPRRVYRLPVRGASFRSFK